MTLPAASITASQPDPLIPVRKYATSCVSKENKSALERKCVHQRAQAYDRTSFCDALNALTCGGSRASQTWLDRYPSAEPAATLRS